MDYSLYGNARLRVWAGGRMFWAEDIRRGEDVI